MKRLTMVTIFLILFLTACSGIAPDVLDRPVGSSILADTTSATPAAAHPAGHALAQDPALQPQNSPEPSETPAPAQTSTPIYDHEGTLQAAAAESQKTHDASDIQLAQLQGTNEAGRRTDVAQTAVHEAETATQAPLSTAAAQTEQARVDGIRSTQVALELVHATQTLEYPTAIVVAAKAQAEADSAPIAAFTQAWAPLIASLMLSLLFLAGSWACMVYATTHQPKEPEETPNMALDPDEYDQELADPPQPAVFQTNEQTSLAYITIMQYEFKANAHQIMRLAAGVSAGLTITHDNFTPRRNGFSRDQFNVLQSQLVEFGLAEWNNEQEHDRGQHPTAKGKDFFARIAPAPARENRSPSPEGFAPIPGS